MNANELIQILENGGAWEDDEGNIHGLPDGELEKAISEAIDIISRSRIRETATEPPTRKDGDECGCVLAKRSDLPYGQWGVAHRNEVRGNTNLYVQWTQLPEVG